MPKVLRRVVQVLICVFLVVAGTWTRALSPVHEVPPVRDAEAALVVARSLEGVDTTAWEAGLVPRTTFRHQVLAMAAKGAQHEAAPFRSYTFLPLFLSVLVLPLIPCLGWRKHGGVFYTSDGALWALAFAVLIPVAFMGATSLTPFTFHGVVFLLLLLVARSYALWPGHLSAIAIGVIMAMAVTVSSEALWALLALSVAIFFGVGWTRVALYWRTLHVVVMVAMFGLALGVAALCGALSVPELPLVELEGAALLERLELQFKWLCVYGAGLLAWGGLLAISMTQKDARWERVLTIFFPICFLLGLFLKGEVGFVFAIPLSVMTPLIVAMVVSRCPRPLWRWWMGNGVLVGLCFGFVEAMKQAPEPLVLGTLDEVVQSQLVPLAKAEGVDLAFVDVPKGSRAQMLWALRAYASGRSVVTVPAEAPLVGRVVVVAKGSAVEERMVAEGGYAKIAPVAFQEPETEAYVIYLKVDGRS